MRMPLGRRWTRRTALALAAATGAVAAGGAVVYAVDSPSPSPSSSASADPSGPPPIDYPPACELLTTAQATSALGGWTTVESDGGSTCSWTVTDPGHFVALAVSPGPQGLTADGFAGAMSQYATLAGATQQHVTDVGDDAYATFGSQSSELVVRRDNRFVTIALLGSKDSTGAQLALMRGVAGTAIGNLGQG